MKRGAAGMRLTGAFAALGLLAACAVGPSLMRRAPLPPGDEEGRVAVILAEHPDIRQASLEVLILGSGTISAEEVGVAVRDGEGRLLPMKKAVSFAQIDGSQNVGAYAIQTESFDKVASAEVAFAGKKYEFVFGPPHSY